MYCATNPCDLDRNTDPSLNLIDFLLARSTLLVKVIRRQRDRQTDQTTGAKPNLPGGGNKYL